MPDYFLQGASLGSDMQARAWAQQDRMMRAQAEQAQQMINERHSIAQARLYDEEVLKMQQARKEQELQQDRMMVAAKKYNQIFLQGYDPMMSDEEAEVLDLDATRAAIDPLRYSDPKLYDSMISTDALVRERNARTLNLQKAGQNKGTINPDVTEKQALALQRADDAVTAAADTGDDEALSRAVKFRDYLKEAVQRQHRDPVETTQLAALKSRIQQLDKNLTDVALKRRWPELQKERDTLQDQLDNWGKPKIKPDVGGEIRKIILKPDQRVKQGGKWYRSKGGDLNDPSTLVEER